MKSGKNKLATGHDMSSDLVPHRATEDKVKATEDGVIWPDYASDYVDSGSDARAACRHAHQRAIASGCKWRQTAL